MKQKAEPRGQPFAVTAAVNDARPPRRWLVFVHQLPSSPSNIRVRTWRRLQQLGAIVVKQAVYVLPDSPAAREDFEWLKTEIEGVGGEATVFAADSVDARSDAALVEEFRRSRQESYEALARDAEQVLRRMRRPSRTAAATDPRRVVQQLRERLAAIERLDFFASAGRDRVVTWLQQIDGAVSGAPKGSHVRTANTAAYQDRLWVTRPRPGVDRMASAWLIRRFIDPAARFGFVAERASVPADSIPFDMFGVELTHQGDRCTFETLCAAFELDDPVLTSVAAIVHDLDLKDGRFGAPEASTVDMVIEGLRLAEPEDHALLAQGITLFEAIYRARARAGRPIGPRPVAKGARRRARTPAAKAR